MRKGEKIIIERLEIGLYRITLPNGVMMIGAAPSTAVALTNAVFRTEAQEEQDQEQELRSYHGEQTKMKIIEFAGQVRKYMKIYQIEELTAYSQIDKDRVTLIFGDRDHAVAVLAKQRVLTELGDYHARGLAQHRAEAAFRMYKAVTAQ